jgi:hypothetical protein
MLDKSLNGTTYIRARTILATFFFSIPNGLDVGGVATGAGSWVNTEVELPGGLILGVAM